MSQTLVILVWLAAMTLLTFVIDTNRSELLLGRRVRRSHMVFAAAVFLPIFLFASLRGDIGDTYAYRYAFKQLPSTLKGLIDYIPELEKDQGFTIVSGLIKLIIGYRPQVYLALIAAFQSICLVCVFRKYSSNYLLSIFLFVFSTDYLSWMFNGIRQFIAVAIVFAATGLVLKKKWVATVLIVLLASTFHQSALIMLPIVFIVQGKAWNKKTVAFLALTLVAVLFIDSFTDILDSLMENTQYKNVVSDWKYYNDDGTNFLRVLVYSVPALISLVELKKIRRLDDPVINFCTNASIVTMGIYIISMFTSGIYIGRLPIYTSLYSYVLLPWEVDNLFEDRLFKYLLIGAMIALYLVFGFYQLRTL